MDKQIKFIDSKYNELFKIPDNSSITVTYPDGHTENRFCKYIDEYHTEINGVCFHICQWAELMERNGNSCAPAESPKYTLENITPDEFEFMYAKEDEGIERGCIGHLRADFDTGKAFYHSWWPENDSLKTPEFKTEFDDVIAYFRKESDTPILKSRADMYNTCFRLKPTRSSANNEISGFKVITEKHTYYLRCNPRMGEYNLYAYCYNTQALDKFRNTRFVEQNFDAVNQDKFFKTDYGFKEVYFNLNSVAGGQIVINEISNELIKESAKYNKDADDFFEFISGGCKQSLIDINTPEFKSTLLEFINKKADFEGINNKTVKGLIKHANKEKKKSEPER